LQSLTDHTAPVLRGIHATLGENVHLGRFSLVHQILEALEAKQVVLVSGPAGSGKSALAKDALAVLSPDHFAFAFRAEEFAEPHLDATLQNAQIPVNVKGLGASLASQDRKILLVESVERLLEKSTRDAFTDLLQLAATDKSWRILLTCRDYSTDLVRASLLEYIRIEHSVVLVPRLDDNELSQVEAAFPQLAGPLSNPMLRGILRNPYFLDKALQIFWSPEGGVPESEREFRELFWKQIVRADHRLAAGFPLRREQTFEQIAVRRARALAPHIPAEDLDPTVLDSLLHDSLIVSPKPGSSLVATAHDVLEDWAILRWIDKEYEKHDGSFHEVFTAIGTHPAMRRAYRKWVSELLERAPAVADQLFEAAVWDVATPVQFRDDTLIAFLQAPASPALLERHSARLLEGKHELLKRVVHLLRVACVATPSWVPSMAGHGSMLNAPVGPAWAYVLQLIERHIQELPAEDSPLLLGMIEDWSKGVAWWAPYPEGAESVAAIAHTLLRRFDNYASEDQRKRTLRIIAKIPKAKPILFERLLRGRREDRRDRLSDDFREIIFAGIEGAPAARDLPDILITVAIEQFLSTDADIRKQWQYASPLDLEHLFGLKGGLRHDYFPASAYHGPFLALLRHHPRKALDFILRVFNHSADWYAHPRVADRVEPPFEIELRFTDGTTQKQWCNARLWNWYRGTSVGPDVLQSILMALERWLFEFAEARPRNLDGVLLDLMRRSDSAAVTAVVASVATAFPHASGESLLVLLQTPMCIQLDRQRMATESQSPSRISAFLPTFRVEHKIYESERKEMDEKLHRRADLESAITNLQLGNRASRVHEILDTHRAVMPPIPQQTDADRTWRLALHRMDLRQYTPTEPQPDDLPAVDGQTSEGPPPRYIKLEPKEPEPDVKALVDTTAVKFAAVNARVGLLSWGLQAFKQEDAQSYDPPKWHERLLQAQSIDFCSLEDEGLGTREGPGLVAAVCVRDHWADMSEGERDWCVRLICAEVNRRANFWNHLERLQRFSMAADRACASAIPLLLGKSLTESLASMVRSTFATALTHPIDEVKWHATWGVANQLWAIDHDLTLRCVNALATEARLVDDERKREETRRYNQRRQIDSIEADAARTIRERFWGSDKIPTDAYQALDSSEWFGAKANERILAILGQAPTEPLSVVAFAKTAQTLVSWWDVDRHDRNSHRERHYETENVFSQFLQRFVLKAPLVAEQTVLEPILNAVEKHPREVHSFIQGLVGVEDSHPNTPQFWSIWKLFADRIRQADWIADIDDEYSEGRDLISAIFLGPWWKDNVRHWKSLEGYSHHIHLLFETLSASSTSLHCYVRFLYHIGERSLPEAFVRIGKQLQGVNPRDLLKNSDTIFMLEVLLQRQVYGHPLKLKRGHAVRDAVLFLLDTLVENGSSAAFRMRDDFVTPLPTE
jgi:hypothetical protein